MKRKITSTALSVILVLLLIAILSSLFLLYRHIGELKDSAIALAATKPDFNKIDKAVDVLNSADETFRLFLKSQQEKDLNAYKQHIMEFQATVDSLLEKVSMADVHDLKEDVSYRIIIGMKKELEEDVREKVHSINELLKEDLSLITYEEIISETKSPPSVLPLLSLLNRDTIFFNSYEEYESFMQSIGAVFPLPADPEEEGQDQVTNQDNVNDQPPDKYFYYLERNNPIFELVTKYLNSAVLRTNRFHAQQYKELTDRLVDRLEKENYIQAQSNAYVADMKSLLAKFRDIETLETDYKAQAGMAYMSGRSELISKIIMGGIILVLLLGLIMGWFLKRSVNYEKELIDTKEHAEALADERSNFLASMSHEIRTPLNSIVGFTELLGRTRLDGEQREMLDAAKVSANVLMSMVNDILDMGKLESGNFKPRENIFNPNEVIEDVVATMDLQAKNKELPIKLKNYIMEDQQVQGDDLILRQVLLNLLSNAIKFTDKGYIQVTAHLKNQGDKAWLKVEVADTGSGISEEKQKNLFKKYYSSPTDKQAGGTGLGLYLCRLMVNLVEGEISCTSKPNEGSLFIFTIPLKTVRSNSILPGRSFQETHARPRSKKQSNGINQHYSNIKDKRFLVVDDNPLNIKLVNMILQKWGGIVDEANDGISALKNLREKEYDIILTDLMMPIMDGFELAKQIKSIDGHNRTIPIIALTADMVLEEQAVTNRYDEFDTVVIKPINEEELYFKLTALLST
jgi:signal transduction histidine kinase